MKKRQFMHIANNIRKKESLYGSVSEKLRLWQSDGIFWELSEREMPDFGWSP